MSEGKGIEPLLLGVVKAEETLAFSFIPSAHVR